MHVYGYFGLVEPPSPAEEAAWFSKLWHGFHQVQGTLMVSSTPFWRINPPEDRRRVNDDVENYINFGMGGRLATEQLRAVLVDTDGVIVWVGTLTLGLEEKLFRELIGVLLSRTSSPSALNSVRKSTQSHGVH